MSKNEEQKNRKKKKGGALKWILLFIIFIAIGFAAKYFGPSLIGDERTIEVSLLKAEIKEINELATLKYSYREIINKQSNSFFSEKYIAVFDGTIKAGIDLNKVQYEAENDDSGSSRKVDVYIPKATILSHEDSGYKTIYEKGYKTKGVGELRNKYIKEKKEKKEKQFIADGKLEEAKEKAEDNISDFIHSAYGEDVVVNFSDLDEKPESDEK